VIRARSVAMTLCVLAAAFSSGAPAVAAGSSTPISASVARSSKPTPAQGENASAKKKRRDRSDDLPYRSVAKTKGNAELESAPQRIGLRGRGVAEWEPQVARYAPGPVSLTLSLSEAR
jgi:hypothetical protein